MTTYGPYSQVMKAGAMYFVSGQIGISPDDKTAPKSIAAQTSQALMNLQTALEEAGLTIKDVVKTTVFLSDMDDLVAMNSVYEGFFDEPRPARSTVAVNELPRVASNTKLLVEIEAIAMKGRA